MTLTPKAILYEYTREDIQEIMKGFLQLKDSQTVEVEFVIKDGSSDPFDRVSGTPMVTSVRVRVEPPFSKTK